MESNLNESLITAIEDFDVEKVKELLSQGANPNYCRPKEMYAMYDSDYENQPYTPLRTVIFRISDSFLQAEDLLKYADIARILIENGADTQPAIQLAESRYGKYEYRKDENLFGSIYGIIIAASQKK